MGAVQNVVDRLRRAFVTDKERGGDLLAKGSTSPTYPDSGYDLLQAYGYDALADYLRMEHDLLSRYVDYEEMDDYPEVACLSGDLELPCSAVPGDGTLTDMSLSNVRSGSIGDLARDYEEQRYNHLLVYSFDHSSGRVVVAKASGPVLTGRKEVLRITYEDYRRTRQWSIKASGDHLFMLRDGSYRRADDLEPADRLMPCTFKVASNGYLLVYEPLAPGKNKAYSAVHRLVAEAMCGSALAPGVMVHHENEDRSDPRPSNLRVMTRPEHVRRHQVGEAEVRRRRKIAQSVRERWSQPEYRKRVADGQSIGGGSWLAGEREGLHKRRRAQGKLSEDHRKAIAKGRTIPLAPDVVEAAVRASASLNEASRKLGVSWNTLVRRMDKYELSRDILGSNIGGPAPGDQEYLNHRVVSVERLGEEDVYDLEVPGYHNFAVGDGAGGFVFVHNSAVDVYADDASQPDTQIHRTVWVTSPDKTLQGQLDDLFYKRLRLDEEVWELTRSLVKYGNDFEEMLVTQDGVVGLNFLPAPTVRRVEGPRGELHGFVQDFKGRFGYSPQEFQKLLAIRTETIRQSMYPGVAIPPGNRLQRVAALEPWEVAHFRLRGKHRRSVYGYSVLEPARWIWKRLLLLEDAALIYRLQRAPERYAFYVDVGNLPPREALSFLNKMRQQHKKKRFVNPTTGKLDMKFEPLSQDDDFWLPVRQGKEGTRIEVLGSPSWQHMDDVEYFQRKLFSALKVPKAYLAQDENVARAVLSSEDVRFARSVLRVQREVRNGLGKIARTHLAARGINPDKVEYAINMTVPSAIFELAQLEVRNARADLASRMREHVSLRWVLENVYLLSDDDIKTIITERSEDVVREGEAQAEVEKMSALAQSAAEREMGGTEGASAIPGLKLLERKLRSLPRAKTGGISEQELLRGNREAEKRADDKLNHLLRASDQNVRHIRQVGGLLREVAAAVSR